MCGDVPDAHIWAGNNWKANSSRETLITLRIIVLEADLELDGLKEISLLRLERVLEELLDVATHSGWWRKYVSACSFQLRIGFAEIKNLPTVILDILDSLPVELVVF